MPVDPSTLVAESISAMTDPQPRRAMREVLERALDAGGLDATMAAGLNVLHNAPDLTVINVVWPPGFTLLPHDHRMWAAIAIYGGREDNTFYRRDGVHLAATGGKTIDEGDVVFLGPDAIHAVHNPSTRSTGAIHVYGGDFVRAPRSQWPDGTEEPYDMAAVQAAFRAAAD